MENVETQQQTTKGIITVNENQGLVAKDNSELLRMIQVMMKGQAFPRTLDTEAKVIAAWQVAASLKIPPAVAIQNLAIVNGSICMWGQLPKALAEATGELEEFKIVVIDETQTPICLENKNLNAEPWGAVCTIKRKNRDRNEYAFTISDMKKAGLDKKQGPWRDYTKIMLMRRAIGTAIKFEFPDAVMGVPIAEYDFHQAPDIKEVSPSKSRADLLKSELSQ
jgi:hypothetical protein